jgi:ADP-heptose:LPS heptosyltransferase
MSQKKVPYIPLYFLDRLTDAFPSFTPRIFQKLFLSIIGSQLFYSLSKARYIRKLQHVKNFDRMLIMVDVNIGDSILMQQSIAILRFFFPDSKIDYICNEIGGELLTGIYGANRVLRKFLGNGKPSESDLSAFRNLVRENNYSLIWNLSPFAKKRSLNVGVPVIHVYIPFAAYVIRLCKLNGKNLQLSQALNDFLLELLTSLESTGKFVNKKSIFNLRLLTPFRGNTIFVKHEAIVWAREFLIKHELFPCDRLIFFNPNATSKYAKIPLEQQKNILRKVIESEDVNVLLLGTGYNDDGIEQKLLLSLPQSLRYKVVIVPHISISKYTALIDACDLFLTGDNGPSHIAASWKIPVSAGDTLRNRTSVVTVFGAADSRMYGYDSDRSDHKPANQKAPSRAFSAYTSCRNISCINKAGKTCREIRCFDGLETDKITEYIISYFHFLRYSSFIESRKVVNQ